MTGLLVGEGVGLFEGLFVVGANVGDGVIGAEVTGAFDGDRVIGAEVTGALDGDGVTGAAVIGALDGDGVTGALDGDGVTGLAVPLPHTIPLYEMTTRAGLGDALVSIDSNVIVTSLPVPSKLAIVCVPPTDNLASSSDSLYAVPSDPVDVIIT